MPATRCINNIVFSIHSSVARSIAQFFWSAFDINSLVKTLAPYSPAIRKVVSLLR